MNIHARPVLALAAAGFLTACGGDGGDGGGGGNPMQPETMPEAPDAPADGGENGDPSSFDAASALTLTGSAPPTEDAAGQEARFAATVARLDRSVTTAFFGEIGGGTATVRRPSACLGTACAAEFVPGFFVFFEPDHFINDLAPQLDAQRAVLSKSGITLVEGRGGAGGPGHRNYGAWMEHGFFGVTTHDFAETGGGIVSRGAVATAAVTMSRPSASAIWRGLMVGTPARGGSRDNILQGDATLAYDFASQELDADFTDIVDLDRNAAHTVGSVSFHDVSVAADGSYRTGGEDDYLRGGFAGPGHEEAGGVFESQGILGAFGAKRQGPG